MDQCLCFGLKNGESDANCDFCHICDCDRERLFGKSLYICLYMY